MAPVDVLAYMLACKKKERHMPHTRSNVYLNAFLKTLADRLALVKAKKFSDALEHVQAA